MRFLGWLAGHEQYVVDEMLGYAAEALLIHAGECVARIDQLSPYFVDDYPELELRSLKDTRNFFAHDYDSLDSEIVWAIMTIDIPKLAVKLREVSGA